MSRSPKHLDDTGVGSGAPDPDQSEAKANARQFDEWLTRRIKDRAHLRKQQRLDREEFYDRGSREDGVSSGEGEDSKTTKKVKKKESGAQKGSDARDASGSDGGPTGQ